MSTVAAQAPSSDLLVSVVVPYYERQDQLDRLLAGLDEQTMTPTAFEVVVADDGSGVAPSVGRHAYAASVVSQADEGFRAAAARNLGASVTTGAVIVFLDQDCVPAPDYLEKVHSVTGAPWDLTVGHRLHAELDGWTPEGVRRWLSGAGESPRLLDEPGWLLDGYERTADLTRPDDRAYQLVISAVLSVNRALHERLGGFEDSLRSYGGEDWDYGHRAVVAGADLRWLPDAVVWHDGPDLPGRGDLTRAKNSETLALARILPDSDIRGRHLVWSLPEVVVRLDATDADAAVVAASVESLLADTDAHVWLGDVATSPVEDPRVHVGSPDRRVLDRARWVVDCAPVTIVGATLRELTGAAPVADDHLRVRASRDVHRSERGVATRRPRPLPDGVSIEPLRAPLVLERHWQSRTRR